MAKNTRTWAVGAVAALAAAGAFVALGEEAKQGSSPGLTRPASSGPPVPVGPPVTFSYVSRAQGGPPVTHQRTMQVTGHKPFAAVNCLLTVTDSTPYGHGSQFYPDTGTVGLTVGQGEASGLNGTREMHASPTLRVDHLGPFTVTSATYRFPDGETRVKTFVGDEAAHYDPRVHAQIGLNYWPLSGDYGPDSAAIAAGQVSAPDPDAIPQAALEGILIDYFGIDNKGNPPGTITATFLCRNSSPYTLTGLKLALSLWITDANGQERQAPTVPFFVSLPDADVMPPSWTPQSLHSPPLTVASLPPGSWISGYYLTLVSAEGADIPPDPSLDPWDTLVGACAWGDLPRVQSLLRAHPDWVNRRTAAKNSLLAVAAIGNHGAVIAYLLAHGANIEAKGESGDPPLATACDQGSVGAARVLLQHGANPNVPEAHHLLLLAYEKRVLRRPGEQQAAEIAALLQQYGAKA